MTRAPGSWLGVTALAVLAGTSIWLLTITRGAPDPTLDTRGPAWYFADARMLATDGHGQVIYRVDAPRIEHDPTDDSAVFSAPVVSWLQGEAPPLAISAASGRADGRTARIRLQDEVRIVDSALGARYELVTDWLEVDADRRIASTDAPVFVTLPDGEMRGTGLLADLNRGTISIRAAVSARYGH